MKQRRLLLPLMFDPEDEIWIQIPDDCEILVGDRATGVLKDIRILEAPYALLADLIVARPEDQEE